jgi:predicted AAA+ superfamily ATPase
MYKRLVKLKSYISHKSIFLLGPRQTGKSTLLKSEFPEATYIDLLESDTFRSLSRAPEQLRQLVPKTQKLVVIDEVQRLPSLLNEVQLMLDRDPALRFILTGSSARKLKRGHANLLGGRALFFNLFPLVSQELGDEDRILDQLSKGSLPSIIDSKMAFEDLKAYVGVYLREEIQAEGLTRSIENFSRFLDFAAHLNAEQMNYTKIGNDAEIPPRTIKDYVKILEDTLVAHILPSYKPSKGRKTVSIEKFYFFDIGVAHALLAKKHIEKGTPDFGKALEHLVFLEIHAYLNYTRSDKKLYYWRTNSQIEVDFVIDGTVGIEVKGTGKVTPRDFKGLNALREDAPIKTAIVVCSEPIRRDTEDGIIIYPAFLFLKDLWAGKII